MQIFTGPPPPRCASGNTGKLLATLYLPHDWMLPAYAGSKSIAEEWGGTATDSGEPGYFRIFQDEGSCKLQGTIGVDMELNERFLAAGQIFTVTTFTVRDNNG